MVSCILGNMSIQGPCRFDAKLPVLLERPPPLILGILEKLIGGGGEKK